MAIMKQKMMKKKFKYNFNKIMLENEMDPEKVQQANQFIDNLGDIELDIDRVVDIDFENIDHRDHPDYSDAFISSANYEHAPGQFRPLTDQELEWLMDNHSDWTYEQLQDTLY